MAEPFIGEIKMVGFNFAPKDWAFCNGAVIPTSQNPALYALLGNAYGGDGTTSFRLPDLRGRVPMHREYGVQKPGNSGGLESVILIEGTMPAHTHSFNALAITANKSGGGSGNRLFAIEADENAYAAAGNLTAMNQGTCSLSGGSQPHDNMQPTMVINFVIALQGYFPQRQ